MWAPSSEERTGAFSLCLWWISLQRNRYIDLTELCFAIGSQCLMWVHVLHFRFAQPFLALFMVFDSNRLLLASGLLTHLVNIAWYCLPFKLYLLVNAWTIGLYLAFVMPQFCTPLDLPVPCKYVTTIATFFSTAFNGPPFCFSSKCYEPPLLPCHRIFFVWHIFMYGITFPVSVWVSEKVSRHHFRNHELNDEDSEVCISDVGVEQVIPRLLYALPLVWWLSSVCVWGCIIVNTDKVQHLKGLRWSLCF